MSVLRLFSLILLPAKTDTHSLLIPPFLPPGMGILGLQFRKSVKCVQIRFFGNYSANPNCGGLRLNGHFQVLLSADLSKMTFTTSAITDLAFCWAV